jgi:hypothetical protein
MAGGKSPFSGKDGRSRLIWPGADSAFSITVASAGPGNIHGMCRLGCSFEKVSHRGMQKAISHVMGALSVGEKVIKDEYSPDSPT